jgi:hypothetical protein
MFELLHKPLLQWTLIDLGLFLVSAFVLFFGAIFFLAICARVFEALTKISLFGERWFVGLFLGVPVLIALIVGAISLIKQTHNGRTPNPTDDWATAGPAPAAESLSYSDDVSGLMWLGYGSKEPFSNGGTLFARVPQNSNEITSLQAKAIADKRMAAEDGLMVRITNRSGRTVFYWWDGKLLYPPDGAEAFWKRVEEGRKERNWVAN